MKDADIREAIQMLKEANQVNPEFFLYCHNCKLAHFFNGETPQICKESTDIFKYLSPKTK